MTSPIIEIENVSKSFGALDGLKGLCFDVMPDEKLALAGPPRSGKTTILRILMALETIIRIDGEPLWHMKRNGTLGPADENHRHKMRAMIGMVFQLFNLSPHKSLLDSIPLDPERVEEALNVPAALCLRHQERYYSLNDQR